MARSGRRKFIGAAGVALVAVGARAAERREKHEKKEEEVAPGEDLMREHGVLRRVMLVYDEAVRRLHGGQPLALEAVADGAGIIRRVSEDYHEKLEEDFLFPRFENARKLTDLVAVLRAQHQAGRARLEAALDIGELAKFTP